MASYSKNYGHPRVPGQDLPYETIYRIALMSIVEKKQPREIARTLGVRYRPVMDVISARRQNSVWIDAIAALGREGLIDG